MKPSLALLSVVLLSSMSFAGNLPTEPGMRSVSLPVAKAGTGLKIQFSAILPSSQKLNPGAPSYFAVYEREGGTWREVKNVKLASRFLSDVLEVNEDVTLANANSEIAIHTTLYHCGKDNKSACYIQGFQGRTKRAPTGVSTVNFVAKPTVDKF